MAQVDGHWIEVVDAGVATLLDQVALAQEQCAAARGPRSVRALTEALPPPPDPLHAAVLATRLLAAAHSLVMRLHTSSSDIGRAHTAQRGWPRCTCGDVAWSGIGVFTAWPDRDPREAFAAWLEAFLVQFDREHPRSPAARAAGLVRLDPVRPWRMQELAERLNISPRTLHRQFRRQFGVRIPEYVQLVRASRAIALFETATKVEAIAWEVGYRSKKDLYAALRRWVGATPAELRALTDEERRWLAERLRERMNPVVLGAGCD